MFTALLRAIDIFTYKSTLFTEILNRIVVNNMFRYQTENIVPTDKELTVRLASYTTHSFQILIISIFVKC